jgi:hypothetical protein
MRSLGCIPHPPRRQCVRVPAPSLLAVELGPCLAERALELAECGPDRDELLRHWLIYGRLQLRLELVRGGGEIRLGLATRLGRVRGEGLRADAELVDRLLHVFCRGRARIELLEIVGRGLQTGDVSAGPARAAGRRVGSGGATAAPRSRPGATPSRPRLRLVRQTGGARNYLPGCFGTEIACVACSHCSLEPRSLLPEGNPCVIGPRLRSLRTVSLAAFPPARPSSPPSRQAGACGASRTTT